MAISPWESGGVPEINVAMTCIARDVLGPGERFILWVQGCKQHCAGCVSPDWRNLTIANLVPPDALADHILNLNVSGITISGGEPMLQAAGLACCIRAVKQKKDLSVICFTGYTIESLRMCPPGQGIEEFLCEIDLLIDSPYIAELDENRGLRGSSNQRFIPLTDKLADIVGGFSVCERRVEIKFIEGGVIMVGIPPSGVADTFRKTIERINANINAT